MKTFIKKRITAEGCPATKNSPSNTNWKESATGKKRVKSIPHGISLASSAILCRSQRHRLERLIQPFASS